MPVVLFRRLGRIFQPPRFQIRSLSDVELRGLSKSNFIFSEDIFELNSFKNCVLRRMPAVQAGDWIFLTVSTCAFNAPMLAYVIKCDSYWRKFLIPDFLLPFYK